MIIGKKRIIAGVGLLAGGLITGIAVTVIVNKIKKEVETDEAIQKMEKEQIKELEKIKDKLEETRDSMDKIEENMKKNMEEARKLREKINKEKINK